MNLFSIEKREGKRIFRILGIKITIGGKKLKKARKIVTFKTFQSLSDVIKKNLHKLPGDIDLILGVERSGIIPAYIIALFLNKNVCSVNEFVNGLAPQSGDRILSEKSTSRRKILVVDDSVNLGNALLKTKERLKGFSCEKYEIIYLSVFAAQESAALVDYYFEIVENPRLFQWNYLNHGICERCCYDLDGVLCVDPTDEQNDDGEKYMEFLKNAKPLFIPAYEINSIVTSRLEKYRKPTEDWLRQNNVKYKNLYMLDMPSAEERRKSGCHAEFKAKIYKKLKNTICFFESDALQARKIAELSGKQCICVSTDEYFR